MKRTISSFFVMVILAASNACAGVDEQADQDNAILQLVLKTSFPDGGYTVVSPETSLSDMSSDQSKEGIESNKKFIYENLRVGGNEVYLMVERLLARNKMPTKLSIKSSAKDGYVVDYKREFKKYFRKGGGFWPRLHKEHPKVHGITTVSLPIYDEGSGLVLIYKGTQSDGLVGAGHVILYKLENGQLNKLRSVMLWIS